MKAKGQRSNTCILVNDLLDILSFDENTQVFARNTKEFGEKTSKADLNSMPLEKLQEMINQKLNEAKHKYSAVMKYSITQN
jgi:hypothetical protein